ncbi:MAG: hypothetical protein Q9218_005817 [Villophora microphyllina]
MHRWQRFTIVCIAVASGQALAENSNITFNYPLDPRSNFSFNFLDDLNVSVVPYQGVKEPTVHLACLSNNTSARNSFKGSDIYTGHPYDRHPYWSEIPLGRNTPGLFDNCQVIWTDGDLVGRSRNFSIARNDTKESQEWGKQPQYYPPEFNNGHQWIYPRLDDFSKSLVVNANDSIVVSWTNGSSAQATILGIKCWDRQEFPMAAIYGGKQPPSFNTTLITTNSTTYTLEMKPYIKYYMCELWMHNSIRDRFEENSTDIFISNATGQTGQTWSDDHHAPLASKPPDTNEDKRVGGAATAGVSTVSLLVGFFVTTLVL